MTAPRFHAGRDARRRGAGWRLRDIWQHRYSVHPGATDHRPHRPVPHVGRRQPRKRAPPGPHHWGTGRRRTFAGRGPGPRRAPVARGRRQALTGERSGQKVVLSRVTLLLGVATTPPRCDESVGQGAMPRRRTRRWRPPVRLGPPTAAWGSILQPGRAAPTPPSPRRSRPRAPPRKKRPLPRRDRRPATSNASCRRHLIATVGTDQRGGRGRSSSQRLEARARRRSDIRRVWGPGPSRRRPGPG